MHHTLSRHPFDPCFETPVISPLVVALRSGKGVLGWKKNSKFPTASYGKGSHLVRIPYPLVEANTSASPEILGNVLGDDCSGICSEYRLRWGVMELHDRTANQGFPTPYLFCPAHPTGSRSPFKAWVAGSNPAALTKYLNGLGGAGNCSSRFLHKFPHKSGTVDLLFLGWH
jgi:hypothetical protein